MLNLNFAHLNLSVKTADIGIALGGSLLQLHDGHHGVGVVREDSYYGVDLGE